MRTQTWGPGVTWPQHTELRFVPRSLCSKGGSLPPPWTQPHRSLREHSEGGASGEDLSWARNQGGLSPGLLQAPSSSLASSPRGFLLSSPGGLPGSAVHRAQSLVIQVCPSSWIYWPFLWHPSLPARRARSLFLNSLPLLPTSFSQDWVFHVRISEA